MRTYDMKPFYWQCSLVGNVRFRKQGFEADLGAKSKEKWQLFYDTQHL